MRMMTPFWKRSLQTGMIGAALWGGGATSWADEKPAKDDQPAVQDKTTETKATESSATEVQATTDAVGSTFKVRVVAAQGAGKHWIGVHAMPITDEALKAQLNLSDRLIVLNVLPDSPAAKSGVKQHDVLLKLGDSELKTLEDLIKAVSDNGEKETTLLVLRGGKETSLKIQPSTRPAEEQALTLTGRPGVDLKVPFADLDVGVLMDRVYAFTADPGQQPGQPIRLHVIGPGIGGGQATAVAGAAAHAFPNGLSLSVTKENDLPAKIVAKKDGKTYETTADNLDVLPKEIREHVSRLLASPSFVTIHGLHAAPGAMPEEIKKKIEEARKMSTTKPSAAVNRIEIESRRIEGSGLDELKKEIEALRKDVQALRDEKK